MRILVRITLLLVALIAACQTSPYTARKQFILLPFSQDLALGQQAYKEALGDAKVASSGKDFEQVRRVGARIALFADADLARLGHPKFDWEFNVIEADKTVNAWALPGGKVAFYTGILPVCATDTGVAVVMGHEIGHALARHGAERISRALPITLIAGILDVGLGDTDEETKGVVLGAYGITAGLGGLYFDREQESDADHIGLMLMAKAGYDPREAVAFWERMEAKSKGGGPPEFLSTHPSHDTRIQNLKRLMPQALAVYNQAKK